MFVYSLPFLGAGWVIIKTHWLRLKRRLEASSHHRRCPARTWHPVRDIETGWVCECAEHEAQDRAEQTRKMYRK